MKQVVSPIEVSLVGITSIGLNFSSTNAKIVPTSIRAVRPDNPEPVLSEGERVFGPITMIHTDLMDRKIPKFIFGGAWPYVKDDLYTLHFCFMDRLPDPLPTFAVVRDSLPGLEALCEECLWTVHCFRFSQTSSLEFFFSELILASNHEEHRRQTAGTIFCADDMIKVCFKADEDL